jgi:hypothetical protein
MPKIKLPYTPEGEELVKEIKEEVENVGGKIDYGENNVVNAPDMREQLYAGGGKVGYDSIGKYQEGGLVGGAIRGAARGMLEDKILDADEVDVYKEAIRGATRGIIGEQADSILDNMSATEAIEKGFVVPRGTLQSDEEEGILPEEVPAIEESLPDLDEGNV